MATIDVASGVVTGVSAGGVIITYTLPTTCIATLPVTVNAIAPPIGGVHSVCEGHTTSLADALPGGTWSSTDTTIATVSGTGVVSGVSAGVITISYLTAICPAVAVVTVNPIPGPVSGNTLVCVASLDTLTDAGGGTWSSSNHYIASIDPATGIAFGLSAGVAIITYTLDVGCTATVPVTVQPLPSPVSGAASICLGATLALGESSSGGVWSSINTVIASISSTGVITGLSDGIATVSYTIASGCAATREISVISVPAITGLGAMCAWGATEAAYDSLPGGSWSSSAVIVSPAGIVTSDAPGRASVTYTVPTGCSSTTIFTVNPLPGPITANPIICIGLTTSLNDTPSGGSWSSSNTALASVVASGIVTGISAGVAMITYTSAVTGCTETTPVTVNPIPSAIESGPAVVCADATTSFADAVSGGVWTSSNTRVATTSIYTGIITGVNAGTATITYTLGEACNATKMISVNPLPVAFTVTGGGGYCIGGAGSDVGLSESYEGFNYQLYNGGTPVGSAWPGSYSNIDFGDQTAAGTYTVIATDTVTSCSSAMAGAATVAIEPLPDAFALTGGGSYCSGGTGVPIGMVFASVGVNYQLYDGTAVAGGAISGTGGTLNFGLKTAAGTYGVIATDIVTGCKAHMSDSVAVTVTPLVTPSVTVSATPGDAVCQGTIATFSTAIVNGGSAPGYKWQVNGITETAATGSSYTYTPANGDIVKAILISDAACARPDSVSNTVTMTVQSLVMPIVSISANPGLSIAAGQYDTLTATVTNGGSSPVYEWKVDGVVVAGAVTATFISNTLANGDTVTCTVIGSGTCGGQTQSLPVTIIVGQHVGISQIAATADNVIVVPNPNKGEFIIKGIMGSAINAAGGGEVSIELTNMLGQVIYSDVVTALNGVINKQISLDKSISNGMYLLNLRSAAGNTVFHIAIEE